MKKLTKLLLTVLVIGGVSACSVEGGNSSKESSNSSSSPVTSTPSISTNNPESSLPSTPSEEETLSISAQLFISNVDALQLDNISISDQDTINAARYIYSTLSDDEKLLAPVVNAKAELDQAVEAFNLVYDQFLTQKEAEETGYAFADLVGAVIDHSALVKEDIELINDLLAKYELLSEDAKKLNVVVEAKTNLDASKVYVESLISLSDEEYAIVQFTASVNKLPSVEDMTIFEVDAVNAASALYTALSSDSKNNASVLEAKAKLDLLVVRGQQLLTIQANADAFIEMVWALPSYDQLEWKNASQNSQITAAENAYINLTEEEKAVSGVASALTQLQAVRTTYDNLKQPYDISKLGFSMPWGAPISVGGGINYTCQFTYATGKDHITVLTQQYGIAREELTSKVRVYLNMYIEAGAVASEPLYQFDITEDWSGLNNAAYVKVLKELAAAGDERIFSGMGICFTVSIESLNDEYASSKYSSFMAGQKIHWEG